MDPHRKLDLIAALDRAGYLTAYALDDATILDALADLRAVIARAEFDLRRPAIIDPMRNPLDDDEL